MPAPSLTQTLPSGDCMTPVTWSKFVCSDSRANASLPRINEIPRSPPASTLPAMLTTRTAPTRASSQCTLRAPSSPWTQARRPSP